MDFGGFFHDDLLCLISYNFITFVVLYDTKQVLMVIL